MKTLAWILVLGALPVGCGGSGPTQAEGPKPDLVAVDKGGDDGGASGESMVALEAAKAKDYATAKAKADAVLAKNGKDAVAHYARGIAAEDGDKDDAAAEKHYRAALASDPKLVGASIFLSALMIKQKKWDEAATVARDGLTHSKGTYELHVHLAIALHGKGEHATAAKSFANAVQLHPDDAALRLDLGEELLEAGDKAAASKAFKGAAEQAKGDASVLEAAAIGMHKADDFTACVATLDAAIAAKPSAGFLRTRALCKHAGKDVAGARKDLDDALKLEPSWNTHFAAAKYAEEANDKKACRAHFLEAAKLAAAAKPGTPAEDAAKKGAERCK